MEAITSEVGAPLGLCVSGLRPGHVLLEVWVDRRGLPNLNLGDEADTARRDAGSPEAEDLFSDDLFYSESHRPPRTSPLLRLPIRVVVTPAVPLYGAELQEMAAMLEAAFEMEQSGAVSTPAPVVPLYMSSLALAKRNYDEATLALAWDKVSVELLTYPQETQD